MDVTPLIPSDRKIIQGYGDGGFRISGERHEGSVIVFPTQLLSWDGELTAESLAPIAAAEPKVQILLLGTGAKMILPPPELRRFFREQGITLDAMDTGAACRTYSVLLGEERRIAAALVAV